MKRIRRGPALLLVYVILIAHTFITLYPMLWMFFMPLKTDVEVHTNLLGLPKERFWEHYLDMLTAIRALRYILNSVWISALTVLGILAFALLAGFASSQRKFKGLQQEH
jgi:ABC-type glycerol-3-phosphate transport system permease component